MKIIKNKHIQREGDTIVNTLAEWVDYQIELDLDELEHLWQLAQFAHNNKLFTLDRDIERNKEMHNNLVLALGFGKEHFIS